MAINKDVYELELLITDAQKTFNQLQGFNEAGGKLLGVLQNLLLVTKSGLIDRDQIRIDIANVNNLFDAMSKVTQKAQSLKGAAYKSVMQSRASKTIRGDAQAAWLERTGKTGVEALGYSGAPGMIEAGKNIQWLSDVLKSISDKVGVPVAALRQAIREAQQVTKEQDVLASKQSKAQTTRLGMDAALSAARTDANQGKGGVIWRMPLNAALADAQKTSKEIGSNWKGIQSTIGGAHTAHKGLLSIMKESLFVAAKWYIIYSGYRAILNGIQASYRSLVTEGLAYYKQQEQQTLGLQGIIAANYKIVDATGQTLTGVEKVVAASDIAGDMWKKLQVASFSVVGTTADLLNIYNAIVPRISQMGGTLEDALKITTGASLAATAMGVSFATTRTSLASLLSGNVRMSNQFTASLGLSQAQVKNYIRQNTLVEELNKKFKPFLVLQRQSATLFQALTETMKELKGWSGSTIFTPLIDGLKRVMFAIQDLFGTANKEGTFVFNPKMKMFLLDIRDAFAAIIPYATTFLDTLKKGMVVIVPQVTAAFRDSLPVLAKFLTIVMKLVLGIISLLTQWKSLIPALLVVNSALGWAAKGFLGTQVAAALATTATRTFGAAIVALGTKIAVAIPIILGLLAAEKVYDAYKAGEKEKKAVGGLKEGDVAGFATMIREKVLGGQAEEAATLIAVGQADISRVATGLAEERKKLLIERGKLLKEQAAGLKGQLPEDKLEDVNISLSKIADRLAEIYRQGPEALESLANAAKMASEKMNAAKPAPITELVRSKIGEYYSKKAEPLEKQRAFLAGQQLIKQTSELASAHATFTGLQGAFKSSSAKAVPNKGQRSLQELKEELDENLALLKDQLTEKLTAEAAYQAATETLHADEAISVETMHARMQKSYLKEQEAEKDYFEKFGARVRRAISEKGSVDEEGVITYESVISETSAKKRINTEDILVQNRLKSINNKVERDMQIHYKELQKLSEDYYAAVDNLEEQRISSNLEIQKQLRTEGRITQVALLEEEEKAAQQRYDLQVSTLNRLLERYRNQPEMWKVLFTKLQTLDEARSSDKALSGRKAIQAALDAKIQSTDLLVEENREYIAGQRSILEFSKERGTVLESSYLSRLEELNAMELRNNELEQDSIDLQLKKLGTDSQDIIAKGILTNKLIGLTNAHNDLVNAQTRLLSVSDKLITVFSQYQNIFASFADTNFGAGIDRFLAGAAKLLPKLSRGVGGASFFGANFAPQPRGYSYIPMPGLGGTPGAGAPQGGGISSFFKSISGGVVDGFKKVFSPNDKAGSPLTGASKVFGIMGNIANIAGAAGSIISSVMAVVDIFKAVFSRAARKIAANIEKDFTTIMSSFNAGTSNLINTISSLEAQRASAIAQLSSKKGGQEQLNKLLPTIDDALASLRKQQTQIFQNFEKSLFVLQQPKGIRTVVQQFQQLAETVKEYLDAGGDATKANKYLSISLQDLKDNAFNELAQAEKDAVDRAIELNDLQKQRLDIVKEYAEKEAAILGRGSIERQLPLILQGARELQKIRQERDDKLADLDRQITITKDRVAGEREIFDITTDIASLRQKSIQLEMEMNRKIIEQLKEQKVLVTSTWGALYNSVAMALPNLNRPSAPVLPSGSDLPGNSQDQNNYMQEWSRSMGNYKTAAGGTEVNITLENISVSGVRDTAQAISIGQTVGTEIASQLEVRLRRRAIL